MSIKNDNITNFLEDHCAKVWLENGIIHFWYKPGAIVDLEVQKRHIEFRTVIGGGIARPVFADVRNAKYWTRDAKQYSMKKPQGVTHFALLTNGSLVQSIIVNSAFKLMKLPFPTKVFTSKEKALKWLGKF